MRRDATLLLLNLAHFFDHFALLILPTAALAMARDQGLSYAAALDPGTWAFAAFALATLPVGWLGDRWSKIGLMRVFWLGGGLSLVAVGVAQGSWGLRLGLAALGVFAAIYHPIATALVMALGGRSGRTLAVNGVFGNLGVAAAAVTTGLIAETLGWRAAFVLPGVVMLALGAWQLAVPAPDAARTAARRQGGTEAADPRNQFAVIIVLVTTALCGGLIFNALTIALPKLMADRLAGITADLGTVGLVTAAVFGIAGFAQLVVGRLLDSWGARRLLLLIESGKVLLLVLFAMAPGGLGILLALPLMLLVFGEIPITAWLLGHHIGRELWGRAYAVQYLLALGVGAAAVPLIAAIHRAAGELTPLLLILTVCSLAIFAVAFLLPRRPALPPAGPLLSRAA